MSDRKPIIFISYDHADEPETPGPEEVQWLSFVTGYLRPALEGGAVEIWVDRPMKGGAEWEREISVRLRACDIFILLVSRHSMSCDHIVDKELEIVRQRQAMGDDLQFFPLLLTPVPKLVLDLVRDLNLLPSDGKPFSTLSPTLRHQRMIEAADQIAVSAAWVRDETSPIVTGTNEGEIQDEKSSRARLTRQSREASIAIASRAAIRVLPFMAFAAPKRPAKPATRQFAKLTSAVFRISALTRVVAVYSDRASDLGIDADVDLAGSVAVGISTIADAAGFSANADDVASAAANASDATVRAAAPAADSAVEALRREIHDDLAKARSFRAATLKNAPLWSNAAPASFASAWKKLQKALPTNEHWDVWFDWYRERLEGVSRPESYELVYATVPLEVRKQGPAAANAWIAEHLPREAPTLNPDGFPNSIPDLPAPFTYSWTPYERVAIVAGAQNLPFFSHFKSEEEHRQVLEACRVGAERLLKMLGEGQFHNVGPLYAPTLRNYLDDLPKTAGQGSILVAHDEALHLRTMFLADVDHLPTAFASRLERVISNQFALDGFYDLVRRHDEAVASAKWTQPFPTDAARKFFGVVEANTPKFFEPEVAEKVQRIEAAAEAEPAATAPSAPSSAPQPPPLPAGSPDPKRSAEHQVAASANALYEVFLKGKDLPLAVEGWARVAHALGDAIGPILTFLKGL